MDSFAPDSDLTERLLLSKASIWPVSSCRVQIRGMKQEADVSWKWTNSDILFKWAVLVLSALVAVSSVVLGEQGVNHPGSGRHYTLTHGGPEASVSHFAPEMKTNSVGNMHGGGPRMAAPKKSVRRTSAVKEDHVEFRSNEDAGRMLIRDGHITLQVDREEITIIAKKARDFVESTPKGYVSHSQSHRGHLESQPRRRMAGASIRLDLRIPAPAFTETMAFLRSLVGVSDDILSEVETVTDVTQQYVDHTARAATLEGTHAAMLKLLDKAEGVKEVLAVQQELLKVVQELESKKAQALSLKSRSDFSTIHLIISQRPLPQWQPGLDENTWAFLSWSPRKSLQKILLRFDKIAVKIADGFLFFACAAVPISLFVLLFRFSVRRCGLLYIYV